jgi:hypothetical protein
MASQPPLLLPRPTFRDRLVGAWEALNGRGAPEAQPVGIDPIAQASPSEDAAPARTEPQPYSRAFGGFSIDGRWLQQLALNDDTILTREGQHDLKLYDAILDDPTCASAFQQRRLAVVSKPWEVDAGDDSAQAQAAADHLRDQLKHLPWDRICDRMLYALWYGFGVGEAMFDYGPDGKVWLQNVLIPDRKWFAFTNAGELRMKTTERPEGEAVPPNKFWAVRCGASHDFALYGTGLAHWCYWPVWFKKNAIKFWAIYLEKFGMPTALGKFDPGADEQTQANLLAAAAAVGRDAAVTIPKTTELELMAQGRTSDSTYLQFCDQMNDALLRIILSQTGTSKSEAQGLGGTQSNVMKDVRDEVVAADSDILHESFNGTIARWLTTWNFGPNVAPPRVYRNLEPDEDLKALAEADKAIKEIGWVRTEESFHETYGEGYEKAEVPAPLALPQPGAPPQPGEAGNVIDLARERQRRTAQFAAFAASGPQPLYVSRKLLPESGRKLLSWARSQGIPNLEPVDELHVTILYSRQPVDWFAMGSDWTSDPEGRLRVPPGGPRAVERFGDDALVLRFVSNDLKWRHDAMVAAGASHDFDNYAPHITFAKSMDFDVEQIAEAFQGELLFGPEIFEPIAEETNDPQLETVFSADELDHIDRWAAALARESEPMVAEFAASLKGKLRGITTPEALRVVLLEAVEKFPTDRLGELAGLSFTAARAVAEAGETDQLAV